MRTHPAHPEKVALSVSASGKAYKVLHTIPKTVAVRLPTPTLTPQAVLEALPRPLQRQAEDIYRTLHALAVHVLVSKEQGHTPSQVTFHNPVELVALHLGISRVTFYKHLGTLHSLGLVASRGHVSSYGGLARKDGTLFAVSLKPGHRARLRYDDLKHKWRDLGADIASGTRTAWAFLQRGVNSHSQSGKARVELQNLKAWAVKPGMTESPLLIDCKGETQEYVYSLNLLSETHPRRRAEQVDRYAQALAAGYGDSSNLNFWRFLLWRAVEGDQRGEGTLYQLQNALTRLRADVAEWEGLKRPGALLMKRLRECGLWDSLNCV